MQSVNEWVRLIWIYLSAGWRFLGWRRHFTQRYGKHRKLLEQTSMKKRTLLFIRHGQTSWNVEQRLPGQLPGVLLNETGRQQAARLADALTVLPISILISSPLERARETAEYIAAGRNIPIQLEPGLMDTNVGYWSGKLIKDLAKSDPAWNAFVKDPTIAPEGVETFPQLQERVMGVVKNWAERDDIGDYPAFVAHADVIKLILAYYSGLTAERATSIVIDNASVSLVELEKNRPPHIVGIGWSPKPGWLKAPELTKDDSVVQQSEQKTV
jgi:probable phosphoglycerate mutase